MSYVICCYVIVGACMSVYIVDIDNENVYIRYGTAISPFKPIISCSFNTSVCVRYTKVVNAIDEIQYHTPHIFRFRRNAEGRGEMHYKHWSSGDWRPKDSGLLILKV